MIVVINCRCLDAELVHSHCCHALCTSTEMSASEILFSNATLLYAHLVDGFLTVNAGTREFALFEGVLRYSAKRIGVAAKMHHTCRE